MRIVLDALVFAVAFALPFALAWWRSHKWGLPVSVTVEAADPREMTRCLAEIAVRLDERPERMRIVFSTPKHMALNLNTSGGLTVGCPGHRHVQLDLRGRWIADHPVPLPFDGAILYVEPVDANRFRVATSPNDLLRRSELSHVWLPVAVSFACAMSLVWLVPEPFVAVSGYSFALLIRRFRLSATSTLRFRRIPFPLP